MWVQIPWPDGKKEERAEGGDLPPGGRPRSWYHRKDDPQMPGISVFLALVARVHILRLCQS